MRLDLIISQVSRYLTRVQLQYPKTQVLKVGVVTLLSFVILVQLLKTPYSDTLSPSQKSQPVAMLRKGQLANSHYDTLIDDLDSLNLNQRCHRYFKALEQEENKAGSPSQEFEHYASSANGFSIVPEFEAFVEEKKKQSESKEDPSKETLNEWHKEFSDAVAEFRGPYDRFMSFMADVRVYGYCYVENNIFSDFGNSAAYNLFWAEEIETELDETDTFHLSTNFGVKFFSWMSRILPTYKKLGASYVETSIPLIEQSYEPQTVDKASFLYNFKHQLNGRGIVIPVKDSDDLENLFKQAKVLRFLGVKLPIQIVHADTITKEDESRITKAFTDTIVTTEFFTMELIQSLPIGFDTEMSPIENVYIVNLKMAFEDKYFKRINRENLKIFSLLFSSFEEAILLDPKVIPLRKLVEYLDHPQYKKYGSYFFPNYQLDSEVLVSEKDFFMKLLPTQVDEYIFGMPEVDETFLQSTRFFGASKSYAISDDIVIINKADHFLGILLAAQLSLMPLKYQTEGIKSDLLFLGPLMAGSPGLAVHDVPVSVIGDFTTEENRKIKASVSNEICSQHRAFLDSTNSNATVLFITDGALNCDAPNIDVKSEMEKALYRTFNKEEDKVKKWMNERTKFKAAIIPLKQEIRAENNIDEVVTALQNHEYCQKKIWCAYNVLGAKDDKNFHSTLIKFDESQFQTLETLTEIWAEL